MSNSAVTSFLLVASLLQVFDTAATMPMEKPSIWEVLAFCRLVIFNATASKGKSSGIQVFSYHRHAEIFGERHGHRWVGSFKIYKLTVTRKNS